MLHPRDLVGKYVNYKVDPGGNAAASGPLLNGLSPGQTANVAAAVYEGADPKTAVDTKQVWRFTFLKYRPGAVTFTSLAEGAVVTGPMSGCYLCKYNRLGQKLAHIGTAHSTTDASSVKAKKAWLSFVSRPDVSDVTGAKPDDFFSFGDIKAAMFNGGDIPAVVGYFVTGEAHALLLAPVPTNQNPLGVRLSKVVAFKKMTMQPWSSIAAMRRFRL